MGTGMNSSTLIPEVNATCERVSMPLPLLLPSLSSPLPLLSPYLSSPPPSFLPLLLLSPSPSPRRQAVIRSRRKKIERLVLKGTKQQLTQVMVTLTPPTARMVLIPPTARMVLTPPTARMVLTPPTARMVLTPPTMRKLTRVKLVSRWLIQRGRDQNRRGPRRIKAKKRRQLLLQRKRYYISASNSACVRTLIVFHYQSLAILCHIHSSGGQVTGGSLCDTSFIQVEDR